MGKYTFVVETSKLSTKTAVQRVTNILTGKKETLILNGLSVKDLLDTSDEYIVLCSSSRYEHQELLQGNIFTDISVSKTTIDEIINEHPELFV